MINKEFKKLTNIDADFDAIVSGSMEIYPKEAFACLKYGMIPYGIFNELVKLVKEKIVTVQLEQIDEIVNPETINLGMKLLKKDVAEAIEKEITKAFMQHVKGV